MYKIYCFLFEKKIVVSNLPLEKIKAMFGYRFEILNTVKEESLEVVLPKLLKPYQGFEVIHKKKVKKVFTEEGRAKLSAHRKGLKKSEEHKRKIAEARKGRGNFTGKRHSAESKLAIGEAMLGNDHVKGRLWIYDSRGDKEKRVNPQNGIPLGYSRGRDPEAMENGIFALTNKSW